MLIRKKRITPPNLTDAKLKQYIKDKMLFRKEQFVLEPTIDHPQGVLFGEVAEKWQLDYIYKPMDERRADGLPKYKLLYLQLIKKAGKTNLLAGEAVVQLLLTPFPTEENYIIAGDKDQAAYLLQKMKDFIARNENFVELFTVYKNEVIVESTGAMIKVLSSTAETKSGLSPDFVIADEFWVQKTRDLWDVMLWDDTYDQPLAIQRVINPDYIYREYFMQDYFNDTGVTTANWNTTTNQLEFDLGEIAQSLPIALNSETYSNATITLTGTNLTNLSLKLSSDGGVNFESVSNNTNHVFTNVSIAGIKFKIEATGGSAEIESIIITYGI